MRTTPKSERTRRSNDVPYRQAYDKLPAVEAGWVPREPLTVIVPVHDDGSGRAAQKLSLVCASLAAQSYPQQLLTVLVVDDTSATAVTLPEIVPPDTQLLRVTRGWGKANAINEAMVHVRSSLVMTLDSDMVLHPDHLLEMAKMVHTCPVAVCLGWKEIIEEWEPEARAAHALLVSGRFDEIGRGTRHLHENLEQQMQASDELLHAGLGVFRAHVGASVMMRTELMRASGGYDPEMALGEDTELGYRLLMAGAVFVPVRRARAFHLGMTNMAKHKETLMAHNRPLFAERIPLLEHLRRGEHARGWTVPTVLVRLRCENTNSAAVGHTVSALLVGRLRRDVVVELEGRWPDEEARYNATADTDASMRELRRRFEGDPRVRYTTHATGDPFPTPFLLESDGRLKVAGMRRMLEIMHERNVGAVLAVDDCDGGALYHASLWSTAAMHRATHLNPGTAPVWLRDATQPLARVSQVDAVWGVWWQNLLEYQYVPGEELDAEQVRRTLLGKVLYGTSLTWRGMKAARFEPRAVARIFAHSARTAVRLFTRLLRRRLLGSSSS